MAEQVRFRDFTRKRTPIAFKIGDDVFQCVKALSPVKLQEFIRAARHGSDTDDTNVIDRVLSAMKFIIADDQYARFLELMDDDDDPIDVEQLVDILAWAVETYGARPTAASSNSSTTSQIDDAGTSSTAGALPAASTPSD